MATSAMWRTAGLHAVSAAAGGVAVLAFAAQHSVDLYAIVDQMGVVYRGFMKLAALAAPFVSGAYGVWKATTKNKILDVAADPKAPEIAKEIPPTPQVIAVAEALKTSPA